LLSVLAQFLGNHTLEGWNEDRAKPFETQATTACEILVQFGDLAFRKPHVFQWFPS
jgi:hypothetical protein